jgi:hypothetical protein
LHNLEYRSLLYRHKSVIGYDLAGLVNH